VQNDDQNFKSLQNFRQIVRHIWLFRNYHFFIRFWITVCSSLSQHTQCVWVCFDMFWYLPNYFNIISHISRFSRGCLHFPAFSCIFRHCRTLLSIFQHSSDFCDVFQHISICFAVFQDILPCFGLFRNISRCFMTFHNFSRRFAMFHDVWSCFGFLRNCESVLWRFNLPQPFSSVLQHVSAWISLVQFFWVDLSIFWSHSTYFDIFRNVST
jgi:hypothetical protein